MKGSLNNDFNFLNRTPKSSSISILKMMNKLIADVIPRYLLSLTPAIDPTFKLIWIDDGGSV